MAEKRFDAWTRRRFGRGAGGLAASVLEVLGIEDADSKAKTHDTKGRGQGKGKYKGKGPKGKNADTGGQSFIPDHP